MHEETGDFDDFKENWMDSANTLNIPVGFWWDKEENVVTVTFAHPRKGRMSEVFVRGEQEEYVAIERWYSETAPRLVMENSRTWEKG